MVFNGVVEDSFRSINHLGVVAGTVDSLNISNLIDMFLPKNRHHYLSHGQVTKAMILNGLGFVERRLYLYPEFFEGIAVERLLGPGVKREHLTDDTLGRTLDAIAEYGPTELFNEIVARCLHHYGEEIQRIHVDTTSFSVYGDYDEEDKTEEIRITKGHPKDGRWDLNQFVFGMATNQHGIPLFVKTFSGNESDKKTLLSIIQSLQKNLEFQHKVYHIADSAFFTEENLRIVGPHMFWISRVPATIGSAKDLLDLDTAFSPCSDARYAWFSKETEYAGISQKWVVYQSSEMRSRTEATYEKNILKETERARKSLKKLLAVEFACEPDARAAAERWIQDHPWFKFTAMKITTTTHRLSGKRGRPAANEPCVTCYLLDVELDLDEGVVAKEREKLGRFILATNDLTISPDDLLAYYKGQGAVEQGFRFLKDKSFRIAEIFLKKPSRIQALAMIMVLCLFVYSLTEYRLRRRLKETGESVLSQLNKPTQNPTLKWVFFKFRGVMELKLIWDSSIVPKVANMNPELVKIVSLLGRSYEKYYF
ncbi:MAG TPA: IS1634 family transposase [Methanospirillum sp.]|uniref:IS1634 family transposase n=1 Tax=Methanospirillum sp. TaxID=45200 RepID=UPI002BE2CFFE|nr:IS1634 family transposase [Methanospirillum sp.]HPY61400.1 IS1634 family transposase [Methanospirillum sp.]